MRSVFAACALAVSACLAETAWLDPAKEVVNWSRPGYVVLPDERGMQNPSDGSLLAAGLVPVEYDPAVPLQHRAWGFDPPFVRNLTAEEIAAAEAAAAAEVAAIEARRVADMVAAIGPLVDLLQARLVQVGHTLPGNSETILADLSIRSAGGQLTDEQEIAMLKLGNLFLIIRGKGYSDDDINTVWATMEPDGE